MAQVKKQKNEPNPPPTLDLQQVEFHRHGFALVPDPADRKPGVAIYVLGDRETRDQRSCSCSVSRKQTCGHILKLVALYKALREKYGEQTPEEIFRSSIWYRLASFMADGCRETAESVRLQFVSQPSGKILRVVGSDGQEMLRYLYPSADTLRFMERLSQAGGEKSVPRRGDLLQKLAALTFSAEERVMEQKGFKTIRRVLEESFWHRFAYHGFREFGAGTLCLHPAVEEASGAFTVALRISGADPLCRVTLPRPKVERFLNHFQESLTNEHGLAILPAPLRSVYKIRATEEQTLEVESMLQASKENGETTLLGREDLERFRYGDLVYISDLRILAKLSPPGKMEQAFPSPGKVMLQKSQVPCFLQEFGGDLKEGPHIVDASVQNLKIYNRVDRMEITPAAIDRGWCWLSLRYGFGSSSISLAEILRARKGGERFLPLTDGWLDCLALDLSGLDRLPAPPARKKRGDPSDLVRLSRMDVLRLQALCPRPLTVTDDGKKASRLQTILDWKPAQHLRELKGLTSSLRPYQKLGVEWLLFLFENGLGGLLCDDMGLGKTHQVMAFMLALREHRGVKKPFLVVCPTTVLSHWQQKILTHAPTLKAGVFYGGQRDLKETIRKNDVLLTSYGILRNDIERLQKVPFALAVFDEIQNIKNAQTLAHGATEKIKAAMRLGLTGTPIENNLGELKALLDATLPGYLGSDESFDFQYVKPVEKDGSAAQGKALSRLISPFTLRRLKKTVLQELPPKIEDIRTCRLSDDQVKLYREALSSRGKRLVDVLAKGEEPIPYMHIFALLTLLKQICDHPALVAGQAEDFEQYQSGKWELFKELVAESLDSGQKVVIYSQYLGMIKMMESFLKGLGRGFVTLTGTSRKRGELISRFNEDPDCRIYIGSLKAGGTGIDLVAGSVVIHYDRWWNAAKEDQATDRVHRIGQRRGVQVFKLVTEGTLEEKISAIIEKKRNLMERIVREDDPDLLKTFSRDELMAMLSAPS